MSNKEKVIQLLDKVPDYKLGYVLAYVQGIAADDSSDDLFCKSLLQDYMKDDDPQKHDTMSLQDFANQESVIL